MSDMMLTNFQGESCNISGYLEKYRNRELDLVEEWLWNELYHQRDIGTASVAWVIEANEIFLQSEELDLNYLHFTYCVMESLEEFNFIPCPNWAKNKLKPAAIKALVHALSSSIDQNQEKDKGKAIVALSCAISGMYKAYSLVEYGSGYEEQLMELDFEQNP